jgi:hypothetical protein
MRAIPGAGAAPLKGTLMVNSNRPQETIRRKAANYFTQAEQRDKLVRQEIEKERAASAAKTAKLRALRLAKEAADKDAAEKRALEKAEAKTLAESRRKRPSGL